MDPATQKLHETLITQSTRAQAGMILAALSVVQSHLLQWPLLDHFASFLETHAPPLGRCAASVSLVAELVSVHFPFFGSASLTPSNGHILLSPLNQAPHSVDWILPSPWSFLPSLPLAHSPADVVRLAAEEQAQRTAAGEARKRQRESFIESAPTLRDLSIPDGDIITLRLLTELPFPCLQSLTLHRADAWLATQAELPLWQRLYHLKLSFSQAESPIALVQTDLRSLTTLSVSGAVGDPFLSALAAASLPALEDVDLRHTSITPAALQAFIQAPKPGLPRLKRLGFEFSSNRREDYYDWNGAAVDWGYERMSPEELRSTFLANSPLQLLLN